MWLDRILFLPHVNKSLLAEDLREAGYPSMMESSTEALIEHRQELLWALGDLLACFTRKECLI